MSQEIENNFEERKKDWDLTGLLDDVIRRYIYQEQIHYFLKCNVLSRNPRSR